MPRSSSSPSMMNLTGSSTNRLMALAIRPTSPPAFLRSSAISARTSSTAALERSTSSLLKLSRVAIASSCSWSSCPSNFACLLVREAPQRLGQVGEDLRDPPARVLMIRSQAAMTVLTFGGDLGASFDHAFGEIAFSALL